jgi:hypothetical protein
MNVFQDENTNMETSPSTPTPLGVVTGVVYGVKLWLILLPPLLPILIREVDLGLVLGEGEDALEVDTWGTVDLDDDEDDVASGDPAPD